MKVAPKEVTVTILQMGEGAATWVKVDKMPTLGQFTGNPGVKQIPLDPTQVSEIAELFFGDGFFDMLCQETNIYYLQNREKYDRSYKVCVVTESTSGYTGNLEIYSGEGRNYKKLLFQFWNPILIKITMSIKTGTCLWNN
jgi:hypothetical protein